MSDHDQQSRSSSRDRDRDSDSGGGGGGTSPGKATRAASSAGKTAAVPTAEVLADFKAALAASDAEAALTAWDALSKDEKKQAVGAKNTLLLALQIIGPRAARVLKEAGSTPSADPRFCLEILHNHPTAAWIQELDDAKLLGNFLKAKPLRHELDQPALERLADFAGPKAPNAALAKSAYEKAWGKAKSGKLDAGGWTALGQTWDRDHLGRMFRSLLNGGIPPAHLHNLVGIYIARQYIDNDTGKKQDLGFGYFIDNTIVMPLYKGEGGTKHDMVGGKDTPDDQEKMGHFQATALHEVGHLVGDQTGQHDWGTQSSSPLHMEISDADEVKKELWDNGKSESTKGDDVSAADAKLYLEAQVRGEASTAFKSTSWAAAGKSPAQFRKKVEEKYAEQPLYKVAKAVDGNVGDGYLEPARGAQSKGKMFAYLTRFDGGWAKYNKEAHDARVSLYSMSSPKEWFAEQYQYYMSQNGEATLPEVKTKFKKIMKQLDELAPGKDAPGISGPRGSDGAAAAQGKERGGGSVEGGGAQGSQAQGGAPRASNSEIHRFQIDW